MNNRKRGDVDQAGVDLSEIFAAQGLARLDENDPRLSGLRDWYNGRSASDQPVAPFELRDQLRPDIDAGDYRALVEATLPPAAYFVSSHVLLNIINDMLMTDCAFEALVCRHAPEGDPDIAAPGIMNLIRRRFVELERGGGVDDTAARVFAARMERESRADIEKRLGYSPQRTLAAIKRLRTGFRRLVYG